MQEFTKKQIIKRWIIGAILTVILSPFLVLDSLAGFYLGGYYFTMIFLIVFMFIALPLGIVTISIYYKDFFKLLWDFFISLITLHIIKAISIMVKIMFIWFVWLFKTVQITIKTLAGKN